MPISWGTGPACMLDGLGVCGAMRGEAALEGRRMVVMLTRMARGNEEINEEVVEYEYDEE